ncbi:MAG: superoxide dismutase family protein [Flavobacteriaceae bacterium]|jgi:Cu-Zn family superoxide dismutase|nr:superoxide dismutase family protein [Flavobacteriaceae bacterium]
MKKYFLLTGIFVVLVSCSTTKSYTVLPKSNTETQGDVTFTQKGKTVTLKMNINNLAPGEHAVHIHEKGDCSAADASSAGGHWNPAKDDHGKWGAEHFHMGDIGNLTANADGYGTLTFSTDKWCIGCDDESKNIIGKSIIIHAGQDDFTTQPTGNAGGRVGCMEIK